MHRNQDGWTVLLACAVLLPMSSLWLLRLALWSSWLLALVPGLGPWPWSLALVLALALPVPDRVAPRGPRHRAAGLGQGPDMGRPLRGLRPGDSGHTLRIAARVSPANAGAG